MPAFIDSRAEEVRSRSSAHLVRAILLRRFLLSSSCLKTPDPSIKNNRESASRRDTMLFPRPLVERGCYHDT